MLARESGNAMPGISAEQVSELQAIPAVELLAVIQRQRLVSLAQADPLLRELRPDLQDRLRELARRETMAALALADFTRQIVILFERAGLPVLVIKGIPLALQTTGVLTSRGGGDLDLLVAPGHLAEAVALLESRLFRCTVGPPLHCQSSFWGGYARLIDYEISLDRPHSSGRQWIDLHWRLSNVRHGLPTVNQVFQQSERVQLNQVAVPTLNRRDAFVHACYHAAKDDWMVLRSLVDIARLSRSLSEAERAAIPRLRPVRRSASVSYSATAVAELQSFRPRRQGRRLRLEQHSFNAQLNRWRAVCAPSWLPEIVADALQKGSISGLLLDWFVVLVDFLLPPSLLVSPCTGEVMSPVEHLRFRRQRLSGRAQGGLSRQRP